MIRKPPRLRPGATIGVVSPSSPITPEIIAPGVKVLEERGYRVVFGPNAWESDGHRAGASSARADDLARLYGDPAIDLIWCAKGGSSACLMREHLDWDALAKLPPKIVIGFSDVSSLHVPLNQKLSIPSIHGPLLFHVGRVIGDAEFEWIMRFVEQAEAPVVVPGQATQTLVGGKARGKLAGGCLSLIRNTLGTPYQIDATDSLFLIEDIDEKPWSVERDLWQLRECGVLQKAAGIVVGEVTNADDTRTVPMARIWSELLEPLGKPCVTGFPFGHVSPNWALPLGCEAELDAATGTLTLLEMPVE